MKTKAKKTVLGAEYGVRNEALRRENAELRERRTVLEYRVAHLEGLVRQLASNETSALARLISDSQRLRAAISAADENTLLLASLVDRLGLRKQLSAKKRA